VTDLGKALHVLWTGATGSLLCGTAAQVAVPARALTRPGPRATPLSMSFVHSIGIDRATGRVGFDRLDACR
jgi:hypothetical protein